MSRSTSSRTTVNEVAKTEIDFPVVTHLGQVRGPEDRPPPGSPRLHRALQRAARAKRVSAGAWSTSWRFTTSRQAAVDAGRVLVARRRALLERGVARGAVARSGSPSVGHDPAQRDVRDDSERQRCRTGFDGHGDEVARQRVEEGEAPARAVVAEAGVERHADVVAFVELKRDLVERQRQAESPRFQVALLESSSTPSARRSPSARGSASSHLTSYAIINPRKNRRLR